MSRAIYQDVATGAAAIAHTVSIGDACKISKVCIHFGVAPTTSENLTITLDSASGAAYDTVLLTVDPSATSATSIVWTPIDLVLVQGDALVIEYTNTDTRTYGSCVYVDPVSPC